MAWLYVPRHEIDRVDVLQLGTEGAKTVVCVTFNNGVSPARGNEALGCVADRYGGTIMGLV